MKKLTCEMCGGTDLIKQDGMIACQSCGCKYSVEEAKRLMIEGTVDVQGTVKVDNSAFVDKYLINARRALEKEDWEEVEKYYNMVEQNMPTNIEAVFFSSFGKAIDSLTDDDYFKKQKKFEILVRSMSTINDNFEVTTEDKEQVLRMIDAAIEIMYSSQFVYDTEASSMLDQVGSKGWHEKLMNTVKEAFVAELTQIKEVHGDLNYIDELLAKNCPQEKKGGCYVATCVYGSYDCPEVWVLRRYRDKDLASTWYGRFFVKLYYFVSPFIVANFGKYMIMKYVWKICLDSLVQSLKKKGYQDTKYEDKIW